MKTMMIRIHKILCTVICICFFSSCIQEDLPLCPPDLRIQFTYDNKDDISLFQLNAVKQAVLFVFNEQDSLVVSRTMNLQYNKYIATGLHLDSAKYRFVVWAFNPDTLYSIDPAEPQPGLNRADFRFLINRPSGGVFLSDDADVLPPCLFGTDTATIQGIANEQIKIPLELNKNRLKITITGLQPTDEKYDFTIKDDKGKYTFDNGFERTNPFFYKKIAVPFTTVKSGGKDVSYLEALLDVLKLNEAGAMNLNITSGKGITIYDEDLIALIKNNIDAVDFKTTHYYDIVIDLSGEAVIVTVNGWTNQNETVELSD